MTNQDKGTIAMLLSILSGLAPQPKRLITTRDELQEAIDEKVSTARRQGTVNEDEIISESLRALRNFDSGTHEFAISTEGDLISRPKTSAN